MLLCYSQSRTSCTQTSHPYTDESTSHVRGACLYTHICASSAPIPSAVSQTSRNNAATSTSACVANTVSIKASIDVRPTNKPRLAYLSRACAKYVGGCDAKLDCLPATNNKLLAPTLYAASAAWSTSDDVNGLSFS